MPKFLLGKVVVNTFEVFANSVSEAEEAVIKWQTGEGEKPEGGVKVIKYKCGWQENQSEPDDSADAPQTARNKLLSAFLRLMEKIPGLPSEKDGEPVTNLIIHPFEKPKT